ncbi:hypothetical protein TNCV_3680161 [Trichonephila clavipes]|nr:hypothetical protein TNCV_3680161 [Trichonephila clavipes]
MRWKGAVAGGWELNVQVVVEERIFPLALPTMHDIHQERHFGTDSPASKIPTNPVIKKAFARNQGKLCGGGRHESAFSMSARRCLE